MMTATVSTGTAARRREWRRWQTRVLHLLPWVRRLREETRCDAYRWSQMPLKVMGDPELRERYRCKNRARWHFTALQRSYARDGDYCLSHLIHSGLYGDMREERRMETWFARHPDVLADRPTPTESQ